MIIPTALTTREADVLAFLARDRNVFEAGALLGFSTVTLAKSARHVWSADPHKGYPTPNASTWNLFNHNIRTHGVFNRITAIRGMFQDVVLPIVDFAWADLTGKYKVTKEFLIKTHHVPIVAIHDYARNGCHGATKAVDEYINTYRCLVSRVDTTVVISNRSN